MTMLYRNVWGAQSDQGPTDQQRADLFQVEINLPAALRITGANGQVASGNGGVGVWNQHITWAVTTFPFPSRDVEAIPIKVLQQTNYQIGADAASDAIDMKVRYAFNQRSVEVLERWFAMTRNQSNGGVGLTSAIKADGWFYWLTPNIANLGNISAPESQAYTRIRAYRLFGCWLRDLKPDEANMESRDALVNVTMKMQIDRYYPLSPDDLTLKNPLPLTGQLI